MVKLAIGMKVMVTNVETDQDIINGTCRTIVDMILHPDKTYSKEEQDMVLKNVPLYLLVKLDSTCEPHHYIKGLEAAVTSVELATKSMQVQVVENDGNQPQQMVKQCQFPVTAACTFTDYQLQG